jgi:hypothetical protein
MHFLRHFLTFLHLSTELPEGGITSGKGKYPIVPA